MIAANHPDVRRVALVFDDGPVPELTEKLLAVLAEEGARVTFCYVGRHVAAHPHLAAAAARAGHELNNHSYTHPYLTKLDAAAIRDEVSRTSAAIEAATGRGPAWFWPPYLDMDERTEAEVLAAGLRHFPYRKFNFASTDDWNREISAASIRKSATTGITDRTIILFHEWREETVAEMPAILTELKQQGCEFVTMSQLAATQAE